METRSAAHAASLSPFVLRRVSLFSRLTDEELSRIARNSQRRSVTRGTAVVRSGDLTPINNWLEEKIWKYGCMKDPVALFESVCGKFDPDCYVAYLEKKFTEVYGL